MHASSRINLDTNTKMNGLAVANISVNMFIRTYSMVIGLLINIPERRRDLGLGLCSTWWDF